MTNPKDTIDVLVIGAGIAGVSAACELAKSGASVLLTEMEPHPGYHTTGQSAAIFSESYGNDLARTLTSASKSFFESPPDGFCDHPLLSPRGALAVADRTCVGDLEDEEDGVAVAVTEDEIKRLSPLVRPDFAVAGVWYASVSDIDVDALMQGFLKGFKSAGGQLLTNAEILSLERVGAYWQAKTKAGTYCASIVVNAAGAWADQIADLAGVGKIGLVPKRRTALTVDPGQSPTNWPWSAEPLQRIAAALVKGGDVLKDVAAFGISAKQLAPDRLSANTHD